MPRNKAIDELFLDHLAILLARKALEWSRRRIARSSSTLAAAASVAHYSSRHTAVYIPHYWAVMVHDGRSGFSGSKLMVWYRDVKDDPRIPGGVTPPRLAQVRKLTAAEFRQGMAINKLLDPGLTDPSRWFMFVTSNITKPTPPNRFFDNQDGMLGFSQAASKVAEEQVRRHLEATRGVRPGVVRDQAVARL